ncbi:MAG TPA: NUDIX hydrolase [Candidatus Limnocylindrales bacterium]
MDEPNPWRRLSRRVAYENAWITVWHDEVVRPDATPGIYGVVHFPYPATGVVALDDEGRVLLVGQYRYTMDAYSWEIPEGGGAAGETPLEGAQRELREETGYRAREWRELGRCWTSDSVTDERAWLYVARDLVPGEAAPEVTEPITVRWVPFDEAVAMCRDGRIVDAMSICALQWLALERLAFEAP